MALSVLRHPRKRVVADKDVPVHEYVSRIGNFLELKGTRDIGAVFRPFLERTSWKTSPNVELLAPLCPLFHSLAEVAPNGAIMPTRLVQSLIALNDLKGHCSPDLH